MSDTLSRQNPLMQPSSLPFGVPDFANITPTDIEEAVMQGIREEAEDWLRIATNPEQAGVENTVAAVDRAGALLSRAAAAFWTLSSSVGGDELDALQERLAPVFSEHSDDFYMNEDLYQRYLAVQGRADLDSETRWLVDQTVRDFERSGVSLNPKAKEKLRRLGAKIASLEAQIDTKISKQLVKTQTVIDDLDALEGLDESEITAARVDGDADQGPWHLPVMNYSIPPTLVRLKNASVRRRALQDSLRRGSTGDPETDTREQIVELARTRAKRAKLLGFPSHAAIVMDEETVPSPQAANQLLTEVGEAAKVVLDAEALRYAGQAQADGVVLEVSDWSFYEEAARGEALGVDGADLKQYLELGNVIEKGIFFAAGRLYGLKFELHSEIPGWSADTISWVVKDSDDKTIGLFMADYYARPGKSGGAWMSDLVPGSRRSGQLPVITNNANFRKPAPGEPTLLSWDDVETVFHEFGHALHGLLTDTYYDATAGTNVPRDFVELPSQLNEMWAFHPEVLKNYAQHWQTGEPLPESTRDALAQSKSFGQAYATMEYVQSALIDQAWHSDPDDLPTGADQVDGFEEAALKRLGVEHPLVVPRYRTPYFAHSFAGGYDAGYYSYMWSEAMVGELEEWFRGEAAKQDGGLNREAGEKLRIELLSRGNSRDPLESFVAVRGHRPDGAAVIRRRSLAGTVG